MRGPAGVLVIDGDPDYCLVVRMALDGHRRLMVVGEAFTVDDGLLMAEKLTPEVVLLDVTRCASGLGEVVPRLTEAVPHAAIIATSAGNGSGTGPGLPAGGLVGHLSKSVPPSLLPEKILELSAPTTEMVLDTAGAHLAAEPDSARLARRFVEATLAGWDCDELVEPARLLVSELVGNAVGHAQSTVDLVVVLLEDRVRVEVTDDCDQRLRRRASQELDLSGRGIAIVETLSQSWGVRDRDVGKTVWFELPR